jgi:AcrR family transcriptional regulator
MIDKPDASCFLNPNSNSDYRMRASRASLGPRPAAAKWALPAQQARSRATRERILDAAEGAFAERGFENARISDIAKSANCSVGAIYFRFRDKDALFLAIAESFAAQTGEDFAAFLRTSGHADPGATIRDFVIRTAANFRRHRGLFRAIVERGFEHPQVMRTMMRFRENVIDALERAVQPSHTPRRATSTCVRVIAQMVFGFLLTGLLNPRAPTRIDDNRAIAGLADAAVAYFESIKS